MGKIMDSFGNHTQTLRILAGCPPGWKSREMLATPLANAYSYGGKIVSFEKPKPPNKIPTRQPFAKLCQPFQLPFPYSPTA